MTWRAIILRRLYRINEWSKQTHKDRVKREDDIDMHFERKVQDDTDA